MAQKKVAHKKTQKLVPLTADTKGSDYSESWQGRIVINDPENSRIADKLSIREAGEYALKVR